MKIHGGRNSCRGYIQFTAPAFFIILGIKKKIFFSRKGISASSASDLNAPDDMQGF